LEGKKCERGVYSGKIPMFTGDYKEKAQTTKSYNLVVWAFRVVRKIDSF